MVLCSLVSGLVVGLSAWCHLSSTAQMTANLAPLDEQPLSTESSPSKNQPRVLILATTTSTQDSGLLDLLIPQFEIQSGYTVKTVAVGSGQAIQMGREGNADVLLVHDPTAEMKFMQEGYGSDRVLVMHNDFVLVGPPSDPAKVKDKKITEALQQIARTQAIFISRGDDSGTHQLEMRLWEKSGQNPHNQSWYFETGQGMGASLTIASEKGGYLLSDRATFLTFREKSKLQILVEGEQDLLNFYHVITVNPQRFPHVNYQAALAFVSFLIAPQTQALIAEYGIEQYGQPLFFPDAVASSTNAATESSASDSQNGNLNEVLQITLLSLQISGLATLLSLLIGLPLGTWLALSDFPGKHLLLSLVNTGMGLPPVVVGLFVAMMLWRSGPFGNLNLIYTPTAIVIAQVIIAAPVVSGLTVSALQSLDPRLRLQLFGLGASRWQMVRELWREARLPLLAALMAGFGAVISEIGASMMVGGNIRYQTRVLTTAIVLETSKGNFSIAIQLSVLLLLLTFLINWALTRIQQRGARR